MRVRVRFCESRYERLIAQGILRDDFIREVGAQRAIEVVHEARAAIAEALRNDTEGFRTRTFEGVGFELGEEVDIDLRAIQSGRRQVVCLAEIGDLRFVAKRSILPSTWERRPQPQLHAQTHPDFTRTEFENLTICAPFSDGRIIPPIAACAVSSQSGLGYLYSQPYVEGWIEINPQVIESQLLFYRNLLKLQKSAEDFLTVAEMELVVTEVIKLATLIYLRSGRTLIFAPSYTAGDILVNRGAVNDIRCIGILNLLLSQKLFEHLRRTVRGPGSQADDDAWFCWTISLVGAQGLNIADATLYEIGFVNALLAGILEGYDVFYGGRSNHSLTSDSIVGYLG